MDGDVRILVLLIVDLRTDSCCRGFGTSMSNSAMVIMWANSDGSITLSQRSAPGEVMPIVDNNPPFKATLSNRSSANGTNPKFAYTRPSNSTGTEHLIWAFGSTNPNSSAVDAQLVQHVAYGRATLNTAITLALTSRNPLNPVSSNLTTAYVDPGNEDGGGDIDDGPLTSSDKMLIAHGILSAIGFVVVLPFGALIARYLRTFTPAWFAGHWVFQFVIGTLAHDVGFQLC